ncbi:hypothetical protein EJ08DRAFT_661139 [Tothia fuscella]|uniref:Uncharacterized protein n=1 Tax=Tothia fuscella TaxID=1048955 RepID=A0A9P4TY25_9PEZI|nr:hypothetical protein EJ08DRAFT_661139 [Tothia fuscella]
MNMRILFSAIVLAIISSFAWLSAAEPPDPEANTACTYYLTRANRKYAGVISKIEDAIRKLEIKPDTSYTSKSANLGTLTTTAGFKREEKAGGCKVTKSGATDNVEMWGDGWGATDGGDFLKTQLARGCGVDKAKFTFTLGSKSGDTREWTANFSHQSGKPTTGDCVPRAAKNSGSQAGFKC